ncbi:MAG: DUF5020 family protein [Ignavibacteria bacterium]
MKKLMAILLFLSAGTLFSQNFQLHYDFGKDRRYFTSTIEMFKPDEYGSTFFFVDVDYNRGGNKSVSLAYWEIARYITIPGMYGLNATIQYNDGMLYNKNINMDFPLGHIWLFGASYPINLGFVTLDTDLLYRADYLSESISNIQLTTTWFVSFFCEKWQFDGFMDIWSVKQSGENKFVLLTEPQLWYNVDNHLSIGSEIEISNNFVPMKKEFQINPTLAVKWNF